MNNIFIKKKHSVIKEYISKMCSLIDKYMENIQISTYIKICLKLDLNATKIREEPDETETKSIN